MQRTLPEELKAAYEANDTTKFESLLNQFESQRLQSQEEQLKQIREIEENVNKLFAKKAPATKAKLLGMLVESKTLVAGGEEGKAQEKIEEIKKFIQDTVSKILQDRLKKDLETAKTTQESARLFTKSMYRSTSGTQPDTKPARPSKLR